MSKVIDIAKIKPLSTARLMEVLNSLMKKAHVNINQLSKNTGLANTTIKRMCTDPECNPTLDSITKISAFFDITPNQLIGAEPIDQDTSSYRPNLENWHRIPILSLTEAVQWPKNIEEIRAQNTNTVLTDREIHEETFAVIAADETLEPRFSEGTILIFDPKRTPKNKEYVMLLAQDKELPQFRQVFIDGPDIYTKTINPAFAENTPTLLKKGNSKILGVLIQAKANYA